MFTGIIKGLGRVVTVEDREKFREIVVDVGEHVSSPSVGASVSISGACLTITKLDGTQLSFEVMEETLRKTTLGTLAVGDEVNIESSLHVGDELGGHFVLGHVDGVGEIVEKVHDGENTRLRCRVPETLSRYIVDKGSIAIDGISLTVCDPLHAAHPEADAEGSSEFNIYLLPLTLERTTLGRKTVGDSVNIEADYLLKAVLQNR